MLFYVMKNADRSLKSHFAMTFLGLKSISLSSFFFNPSSSSFFPSIYLMPLKKPQLQVPSISETDRNTGRQRQSKRDEASHQLL
jgi:hypothetical protein